MSCQFLKSFLNKIDNIRVLGNLLHELHGPFDFTFDSNNLALNAVTLGHEIASFSANRFFQIVFHKIKMAATEKNLGQMRYGG
ncbi:MAG: hypothetical protein KF789_04285 [Bdellovibrionaceae bacterium]|nr:hypothetical protein [Pseudobdellovibrionaceae bacterium]